MRMLDHLSLPLLLLLPCCCLAPIPPCSPFAFINRLIPENPRLRWLFHDYPAHPVPPCRWENPPAEFWSLFHYFAGERGRLVDELQAQGTYWVEKVLPRLNRKFWSHFGRNTRNEKRRRNKKYPWED